MKISTRLGRGADDAPPPDPDTPPAPPGPPRGSPVAAYVGILDGQTLWLAVDAMPGTLALRNDAGEVMALHSDLAEDDPAYRSVRSGLLELPGDAEEGYDVVLVPGGVRRPRQVWVAPFPKRPTRVPPSRDGRWRFALVRTEEGMLRVRRNRPVPGLEVLDLALDDDAIRITVAGTDATEVRLVAEDTVLATCPLVREDDRAVARVTEPELPVAGAHPVRLLAGDVPLRRRSNDLVNPQPAVLLPVLAGADPDRDRLRLRWSPDGLLVARILSPDEDES